MTTSSLLRPLGNSGLRVHPLCLGGNVFGWRTDRDASFAVLDAYVERGGNFVDTADVYSKWVTGNRGGESELIIGEWLKSRGCRDAVVIASKVGLGAEDLEEGLSYDQVITGCDASLRRLGVETIDLFYAHMDLPEPALEETLSALAALQQAGKVREVAASNYTAPRLVEALDLQVAHGWEPYVALQNRLNLVARDEFGSDLQAVCEQRGVGGAAHSALAAGFLTGKYRPGQAVPAGEHAATIVSTFLADERNVALLAAADRVAARLGATVTQVALAWALAHRGMACVIASATTPAQVEELFGAVAVELGADDLAELGA